MKISDPLIELLAIKLFEHAQEEWPVKYITPSWRDTSEEDREIYRRIARGEDEFISPDC
jgi:hypothetical protein